jgi:hypothetical protein
MPVLHRITIDLVAEEELSQRRMDTMAREAAENLHLLIAEKEDQAILNLDKYAEAHVHNTEDGDRCGHCLHHSKDYRSGNTAVG